MYPRIELLQEKLVLGKSLKMSYLQNKTVQLWQSFMPLKKHICNIVGTNLYSIQVYDEIFDFNSFDPAREFTKWAAVEIFENNDFEENLEILRLESGLYAVFLHQGSSNEFLKTFEYIFTQWLPTSGYAVDNRPHFEVLGQKYKNNNPNSEEEIWIPIKNNI